MSRRSRFAAAGALLLLLAAIFFLRMKTPAAAPEPIAEEAPSAAPLAHTIYEKTAAPEKPAPSDASLAQWSQPEGPSKGDAPMDRASFNKRKAAMIDGALNDVRTWIKYPLWSQPLGDNMQYHPPLPFHGEHTGPDGAFPTLEIFTDRVSYAPGDAIKLTAIAKGPGGPIDFDALTAHTMSGDDGKPLPNLAFDFAPGNPGSIGTLVVPAEVARKNRGEWGINVDCMIEGQHRVGHLQVFFNATDAVITGPYRVAVEAGSLSVYVGITGIVANSRNHVKGELWGPHAEPIAYAWVRNDATPAGPSEMKLVFYGKTIRDSDADGPYTVKNLVMTTFEVDNSRITAEPVDPQLVTPPFKRTDFTDLPINGGNDTLRRREASLQSQSDKAHANGYDPDHPEPEPDPGGDKNAPPPQ